MKRFFALFLILLIAGCTSGGSGGLSLSMSANPTSIKDTQKSLLTISVQNNGDVDTKPTISLYGLGEEWSYDEPSFDWIQASNKEIGYIAELKKESIFLEYVGDLPKGKAFTFEPSARLCYDYITEASAKVEVYTEEEFYRNNPQQKGISVRQTKAPIQISIDSKQPLLSGETLLLDITLSNVGGGTVTTNGCDKIDYKNIDFKTLNTINNLDIELSDGTQCVSIDKNKIYLKKGDTAQLTLSCDSAFTTTNPQETKDLVLNIGYSYYIDAKTSITVTGTEATIYDKSTYTYTTTRNEKLKSDDFCSQICYYAGETSSETYSYTVPTTSEKTYMGYCHTIDAGSEFGDGVSDFKDAVIFGEQINVMIKEPIWKKEVITAITKDNEKLIIDDLELHDAQVGDFGILSMTIGQLDMRASSDQYSRIVNDKITPGTIGLVDSICEGKSSSSIIKSGKSKNELCKGNHEGLNNTVLSNLLLLNGIDLEKTDEVKKLNEQKIKDFKIVSIANHKLSDMSEVKLTNIKIDQFKLSALKEVIKTDFLNFAKCKYGDTSYTRTEDKETHCMCVTNVGVTSLKTEIFVGTSKECSKTCDMYDKKDYNKFGACLTAGTSVSTKECRSGLIYEYGINQTSVKDCGDELDCHCYTKENLNTAEKKLLCP